MKKLPKDLIDRFRYCKESPTGLVWNVNIYRGYNGSRSILRAVGDTAGYIGMDGYARVFLKDYGTVLAHRVIWCLFCGDMQGKFFVDHIDGDRLNNSIENLRLVERALNTRNMCKMSTNKSGVTGVSYDDKGKEQYWKAKWSQNGKPHYKVFNISVYGDKEAFRLACEHRARMIAELNANGAGYTERHGI